jgi:hypothetical protein
MSEEYTPHRFNPDIATVYGIPSALVYQYINFRSREQRRCGKSAWVDFTIDELCKQYPYFGRKQVWSALQNLIHPGKKTPQLILRKNVANIFTYAPVAEDDSLALHFFDVKVAVKFGVVPAIIYQNVGYWITKNWKDKAELLYRMLKPEKFAFDDRAMQEFAYDNTSMAAGHFETITEWVTKRRPYLSQRTARRGFSCLQKAGWFGFRRIKRGKPMWFLTKKLMNDYVQKMLEKSDLENVAAKRKQVEAKKECLAAKRKCVESNRKQEPALSHSNVVTCRAFGEAVIEEAVEDCGSKVRKAFDDFASRSASGSEHFVSRKELTEIRKLNRPNFPAVKQKISTDAFGNPVKRKYTRKLTPDDPDFLERLEMMSEDERQHYFANR